MNKKKNIALGLLSFFIIGCSEGQQTEKMKQTAQKLISYLHNSDSSSIKKLIADPYILRDKSDFYGDDFKTFKIISNKHGAPRLDSVHFEKGKLEENIIIIPLITKQDTSLNLKRCDLVIFFYPEKLSTYDHIYTYNIYKQPYKLNKSELIIAEPLPGFKKNWSKGGNSGHEPSKDLTQTVKL